ncbi:c-type cytochrome [Noviherbaspirillum pedocola]|uniref:Cytochrome c n=1 Tax=Noviherbaspirillum pedocola TaxID=2801341 RepID=A0A934SY77_9BURK|nr:cytochrome c [Noviherbaspirillum pedocola]MBK4737748.1 cytochrome c [Noviherbaspirillum pedocola]
MRASKFLLPLLLALAASAASAQSAAPAKAAQCFTCHGADGIAKMPDAPNLAGQNESYLVKALEDFRSGRRENEVMTLMAKPLSDEDIRQLAAYYNGIAIEVKKK